MKNFVFLIAVLLLLGICGSTNKDNIFFCEGFSASSPLSKKPVVTISSQEYKDAMATIDAASRAGTPSDDLYEAVRVIDRNAKYVYPDEESKEALWERAYGSWKLVLATGGGRSFTFKPVPIFAFAVLDEENFGNGVGINENIILLSLLGPHELITKRRQMMINIDDIFLASNRVTENMPGFIGNGIGLGKRPIDYKKAKSRPPAFVFIAASQTSLVARGGTGGIAIWTRLENDIRPAAYSL
mmetsp:Transcript_5540/g.13184  ORF Transcript_5540/g.13184 Transcript_5540/m.13184 type:complete len:242 (-) Transcript_5540:1733-2458(-)